MLSHLIQSLNSFTRRPQTMTKHIIDTKVYSVLLGLSEDDFVKLAVQNGCGPVRDGDYGWDKAVAIAQSAYRRGADDQLEACAEWLQARWLDELATSLRDAMCPSLKKQALAILEVCDLTPAQKTTIREALKDLPE